MYEAVKGRHAGLARRRDVTYNRETKRRQAIRGRRVALAERESEEQRTKRCELDEVAGEGAAQFCIIVGNAELGRLAAQGSAAKRSAYYILHITCWL